MGNKLIADLNKAMAASDLSAQKLAALAGISVTAVSNLRKGKAPSTPGVYAKVIVALKARINPNLFLKSLNAKKEALGVSMLVLSRMAGVSYRTLYKIEVDKIIPAPKTCCRIVKKLGLSLDELVDWPSK